MKVLVVNAYDDDSQVGVKDYKFYFNILKSSFNSSLERENHFVERRYDQLSDIVVDWEHEPLRYDVEDNCRRFDRINFVVICGDMHLRPWEPKAAQVVSLVHMAKFTKKPLLGTGFGAFATMYSLATKGARFNILNGPNGSTIEELPSFPHYSVSTGAFPSAWMDNETGDLYSYEPSENLWKPICNIGMHLEAATGKPMSTLLKSCPVYKAAHQDERIVGPSANTIVKELHDDIVYVLPAHLQHFVVEGLSTNRKSFPVKLHHNWYFNPTHSLPLHENILVIGEGSKCGPIMCIKDNMLMVTNRVEPYNALENITKILTNFIHHHIHARYSNPQSSASPDVSHPIISLHCELFGPLHERYHVQHAPEDSAHRMALPLSKQSVPSRCSNGRPPIKVDPPVLAMFFQPYQDKTEFLFTNQLVKQFKKTNVGRKPKMVVQNPFHARQKRLEQLFGKVSTVLPGSGSAVEQEQSSLAHHKHLIEQSLAQSQTGYSETEQMPSALQDLLAGVVMKENNISIRRHHISAEERYYQAMVRQQKQQRIGTSTTSATSASESNDKDDQFSEEEEYNESEEDEKETNEMQRGAGGGGKGEAPEKVHLSLIQEEQEHLSSSELPSTFSSMSTMGELGVGSGIEHHKQQLEQQQQQLQQQQQQPQQARRQPHPPSKPSLASSSVLSSTHNAQRAHVVFEEHTTTSAEASHLSIPTDGMTASKLLAAKPTPRLPSPTSSSTSSSTDSLQLPEFPKTSREKSVMFDDSQEKISKAVKPTGNQAKAKVPQIPNWSTVFAHSGSLDQQIILSSQSARSGSKTPSETNKLLPSKPSQQPPSSARSAVSSSSSRPPTTGHRKFTHLVNPRSTQQIIHTLQEQALPVHHPKHALQLVKPTNNQTADKDADDSSASTGSNSQTTIATTASLKNNTNTTNGNGNGEGNETKVIVLPFQSSSPRSNYHLLQQTREAKIIEEEKEYLGMYSEPFLSQQEKALKEEMRAKTKFVAGTFKRYFASNSAYSALEKGKVGLIGPHGPYPDQPEPGYNPKMTAADWVYLQRPGKETWIAGSWKR